MACCSVGYATDRFKNSVDKNFLCPICAEVLKDPVQCQNQHYFCKVCIKKHLEKNTKSCPICVQDLSEETLAEPPRILTDYLNGLMISCDHSERGCTEVVQVSRLKVHADTDGGYGWRIRMADEKIRMRKCGWRIKRG